MYYLKARMKLSRIDVQLSYNQKAFPTSKCYSRDQNGIFYVPYYYTNSFDIMYLCRCVCLLLQNGSLTDPSNFGPVSVNPTLIFLVWCVFLFDQHCIRANGWLVMCQSRNVDYSVTWYSRGLNESQQDNELRTVLHVICDYSDCTSRGSDWFLQS